MNTSWKTKKLMALEREYGKEAKAWSEIEPKVYDDRSVYINIYKVLVEALNSLEDEPHSVVRVAMNRYIAEAKKTMDKIRSKF